LQLAWGALLVAAESAVLPHPQVMPQIRQIEYFAPSFLHLLLLLLHGCFPDRRRPWLYLNYKKLK
jgi:hypothetical protein